MSEPDHRYRLIESRAADPPPTVTLCTVAGAIELGVSVRADDDLLVLYQPDYDRGALEGFAERLRAARHEVVW